MKVVVYYEAEAEGGPRDIAVIRPGHNAWVVGDEPCFMVDFTGVVVKSTNNSMRYPTIDILFSLNATYVKNG